jgi:aminoglycoside 2'-N-acetyltransferase I
VPRTRLFTTEQAPDGLLSEIRSLLDHAFEDGFSEEDWEHTVGGWHAIVSDGGAVVSHAAVVPRALVAGDRPFRAGYVEGVGTLPSRTGEGLGSLVVGRITSLVRDQFGLGALSTGRHGFYERLGWERWKGQTFALRDGERIRTEEDDDGIMVLRFGPSRDLDLTMALSCESRSGDVW